MTMICNIKTYVKVNNVPRKQRAGKNNMTKSKLSQTLNGKRKMSADEYVLIYEHSVYLTTNLFGSLINLKPKEGKLNVFHNLFSIFSYRIYVISTTPKRSVSVLVLQVGMSLMYNQATFPFQKFHKT